MCACQYGRAYFFSATYRRAANTTLTKTYSADDVALPRSLNLGLGPLPEKGIIYVQYRTIYVQGLWCAGADAAAATAAATAVSANRFSTVAPHLARVAATQRPDGEL